MGEKYELTMVTRMSTAFWGKSLEFKAHGKASVKFYDTGDYFLITRPNTSCRNIIFGSMYLEHHGKMTVENMKTGDRCDLQLNKASTGYFSKNKKSCAISGKAIEASGLTQYLIEGNWNEYMNMCPYNPDVDGFDDENAMPLWKAEEPSENWERLYHFSTYCLQLNKITQSLKERLPPTDSRLRTDQRALENGDLTLANSEKHRLEERQRDARKKMEKEGISWKPNYFEEYDDPDTKEISYIYINDYWKDREERNWDHMPDLFGDSEIK
jgi:hypothetical protein